MLSVESSRAREKRPLVAYRLTYQPHGQEARFDSQFEAPDIEAAYEKAGALIAANVGHPDAFVMFDAATGEATIGAGYRSWRCRFTLMSNPTR